MRNLLDVFQYSVTAVCLGKISAVGFTELQETSKPAFEAAVGYASCTGVMVAACALGAGAVHKFLNPEVV